MSRCDWYCLFRSIWIALWAIALLWTIIADYPGCPLWELVFAPNAAFLWEMVILNLFFGVVLDLSLWAENKWARTLHIFKIVRVEKE